MAETVILSEKKAGAADRSGQAIAALEVSGLSHSFGKRQALVEVGFTIPPGSFTVLLGQNGAGKTTLFSLITRLYNNRTGSIRIFGVEVRARPSRALGELGVVFQQRTIDLELSVMQNLLYAAGLQGIARRRGEAARRWPSSRGSRWPSAAATRSVSSRAARCAGSRSRARCCTGRSSCCSTSRPSASTSARARRSWSTSGGCARRSSIGVLWATHLIDEVGAEDQVILLHQGRILAQGDGDAICAKAKTSDLRGAFTKLTARAA